MKEQLSTEKFRQKYVDDTTSAMSYPSTTYVYKNVTLTMSNNYSDEQKEEWIQKMETAVDNNEFEYTDELSDEEFDKIKNEIRENDKETINKTVESYITSLQDTIDKYIRLINNCKKEELNGYVKSLQYYKDMPIVKSNYDDAMAAAEKVAQKYQIE